MLGSSDFTAIPIVDVAPLITGTGDRAAVIARLDDACHRCGFFYLTYLVRKVSKVFPELHGEVLP